MAGKLNIILGATLSVALGVAILSSCKKHTTEKRQPFDSDIDGVAVRQNWQMDIEQAIRIVNEGPVASTDDMTTEQDQEPDAMTETDESEDREQDLIDDGETTTYDSYDEEPNYY